MSTEMGMQSVEAAAQKYVAAQQEFERALGQLSRTPEGLRQIAQFVLKGGHQILAGGMAQPEVPQRPVHGAGVPHQVYEFKVLRESETVGQATQKAVPPETAAATAKVEKASGGKVPQPVTLGGQGLIRGARSLAEAIRRMFPAAPQTMKAAEVVSWLRVHGWKFTHKNAYQQVNHHLWCSKDSYERVGPATYRRVTVAPKGAL